MSKAAASSLPPPPKVAHLVEQLQHHHLAPDASLLSNSAHSDLLQAVYAEAVVMVEEYQHTIAAGGAGAGKKLNCSPQVYESLDHHLVVAEVAQSLGITSDYLYQVQQEQPAMTVVLGDVLLGNIIFLFWKVKSYQNFIFARFCCSLGSR